MWCATIALFVTLLLAIIGVSLDNLMVEKGQGPLGFTTVTLDYGWQEMSWTFETSSRSNSSSISYDTAYNEYCADAETQSSYCTDLKNVRDAGRVYIAFNIIGIFLLTASLSISILAALGKCLCSCRCRVVWIISLLCMLSIICFLVAFGVFLSDFSQHVDSLFNDVTTLDIVDWYYSSVGSSIACLITASCLGLGALSCILWPNRCRRDQYYTGTGFGYGMPPPPMYAPYGMPPPGPFPPGPFPTEGYSVPSGTYYQQVSYNTNMTPV